MTHVTCRLIAKNQDRPVPEETFTRSHLSHPLSPFSICNGPWHPLYSAYVLDSPLEQPLSRSSLVFPLVLYPQLHTPCISSPKQTIYSAEIKNRIKGALCPAARTGQRGHVELPWIICKYDVIHNIPQRRQSHS